MPNFPQLPHSDDSASRSRNSSRWIDLIAFLSVLVLQPHLVILQSLSLVVAAAGAFLMPRAPS
jgi:hypothetical protein